MKKNIRFILISFIAITCITACKEEISGTLASQTPAPTPAPTPSTDPTCVQGYIPMPSSIATALGFDLCVAKYEMKASTNAGVIVDDGRGAVALDPANHVAVSRAESAPWTRITQAQAIAECAEIGASYRLITNAEWNLIARDIEAEASNWSNGMLNSGHSDGAIDANAVADGWSFTGNLLVAGDDNNGYEGTGNNSGQAFGSGGEQKRTHTLSNGEVIWDMAGNARERVDIDGLGGTLNYTGAGTFSDLNSGDMTTMIGTMISSNAVSLSADEFLPSSASLIHLTHNIGKFYSSAGVRTDKVITRGSNFSLANSPGIFAGDADEASNGVSSSGAFRCVYQQ